MTTIDTKTVTMYLVQNDTNTITKQGAWSAWYCLIQIPLLSVWHCMTPERTETKIKRCCIEMYTSDCFKILDSGKTVYSVKLKEAFYIKNLKRDFNTQIQHFNTEKKSRGQFKTTDD